MHHTMFNQGTEKIKNNLFGLGSDRGVDPFE